MFATTDWPTLLTAVAAVIAALAGGIATVLGALNHGKMAAVAQQVTPPADVTSKSLAEVVTDTARTVNGGALDGPPASSSTGPSS